MRFWAILIIYVMGCSLVLADKDLNLRKFVTDLEQKSSTTVGLAVTNLQNNATFIHHPQEKFPLASVNKIPIAVAIMNKVQKGELDLATMLAVNPNDLAPGSGYLGFFLTHHGITISVYDLLESMIAISDNTATDVLLEHIGGPAYVKSFLTSQGLADVSIDRNTLQFFIDGEGIKSLPPKAERNLKDTVKIIANISAEDRMKAAEAFDADPRDTATPKAMNELLAKLATYQVLSKENSDIILEIMSHTMSRRLREELPERWKIANKSGSWYYRTKGFSYCNDVGIVTTAEGKKFAVTALVKSTKSKDFAEDCAVVKKVGKYLYTTYM